MLDREEQYQRAKVEKVTQEVIYNDEMQDKFIKDSRTAGEPLAKNIKEAFFSDVPWSPKIAFSVGYKMTEFKKMMRPMYQNFDDIQLLKVLGEMNAKQILDIYVDMEMLRNENGEIRCSGNQKDLMGKQKLMGSQQKHSGGHITDYMETPLLP